ncbi:hypothetical protein GCM10007276_26290 [Agaricicola taiwanensis]|uniref:Uncharacterized protein n=1 Tax=Agaricicola taiwanensis TaxID=591372 RepID=A0A8J2YJZ3_9RHOB|nr:hypothetical protein [Agaricicola taiwanensis]GGE47793.1 hypothetical protein GCM10007276_26290 [Agaricicola taiwanensis]
MLGARRLSRSILLSFSALCVAQAALAQSLAPEGAGLGLPVPGGQFQTPPRSQPLAPVSPAAQTKTVLAATAYFTKGKVIPNGLLWRVFSDQSDVNGNFPLVAESKESQPLFTIDPGGYVVHVTYGLATATEHVILGSAAESVDIVLEAGALRLTGIVNEKEIDQRNLVFQVLKNEGGVEHSVLDEAKPGQIIRLGAGSYQIASTYGNANSRISVDLNIEPGKITDATLNHKAATVRLKLTKADEDVALSDTDWSILTPGGDPVTNAQGPAPELILAEGDYVAVAQNGGKSVQKEFTVRTGETLDIALTAP